MSKGSAVYEEWEQLASDDELQLPASKRHERARQLYDRCWDGERWLVGFRDAELVSSLICTIALGELGDPRMAREAALALLAHPELSKRKDIVEISAFSATAAAAACLMGDESIGFAEFLLLLDRHPSGQNRMLDLIHTRNALMNILRTQEDYANSVAFKALVADVIGRFRGCRRQAAMVPAAKDATELIELLWSVSSKKRATDGS